MVSAYGVEDRYVAWTDSTVVQPLTRPWVSLRRGPCRHAFDYSGYGREDVSRGSSMRSSACGKVVIVKFFELNNLAGFEWEVC